MSEFRFVYHTQNLLPQDIKFTRENLDSLGMYYGWFLWTGGTIEISE